MYQEGGKIMETNYFAVTAMCGHVGKNNYIAITFPIKADNGREAAEIARWMPRVKHHVKETILDVRKINFDEYEYLIKINQNDDYLKVSSRQEQIRLCVNIEERTVKGYKNLVDRKLDRDDRVSYKLKKQKIIEKSINSYLQYAMA